MPAFAVSHAPLAALFRLAVLLLASAFPAVSAWATGCPRPLTLGVNEYPPYHIREVDGHWGGLDTELISAIANRAGCPLSLVEVEGKRRLAELEHGRLDMTGAASITPERQLWGQFSRPYRDETLVLFMRTDDSRRPQINAPADILSQQLRVAVQPGAVYGTAFTALREQLKIKDQLVERLGTDDRLLMVARGRVDATPEDLFSGVYTATAKGLSDSVSPSGLILNDESVHLLFSRRSVSAEVVAAMDTAIQSLQEDGTFQAILARYGATTPRDLHKRNGPPTQ